MDENTLLTERCLKLETEVSQFRAHIAELEATIEWLKNQLLNAKRAQFGVSSEKVALENGQLSLFEPIPSAAPPESETEEISYKRKKQKGRREADLANFPVERIDYELPETERICPDCGELMRDIGVEIRRELKLIPAKAIVVEHATHTYACRKCETTGIRTPIAKATAPRALIPGSLASASLVAYITAQKYLQGLPLYRIEDGFRYDGVNISRQTMDNWVIKCVELYLEPIYALLKKYLLQEPVLHADETIHQVLREPGRAAQTKSYEWVYETGRCSTRKIAVYEYRETRGRENPQRFLGDWEGYLHTDGWHEYHVLPPGVIVVGCWVHARRYFEKTLKNTPKPKQKGSNAETGLAYINALFKLERECAELSPEERFEKRLEKSKPISDAFFAWAEGLHAMPKTPLGEAVGYALNQRKYLENVWLDGRLELSNNRAERAVKPFVIGRKSWLFSCSPAGARASSVMYSLVETAKLNGLNPRLYLEFLLDSLPNSTTGDLESLLPWSVSLPEICKAPMPQRT